MRGGERERERECVCVEMGGKREKERLKYDNGAERKSDGLISR